MARRHLTAALIFLVLTLLLTNPLALHVWNAVEDKQDGLLNTWIVAWVGHAMMTDPLHLFNTNIFYPYTNTLAYSEILIPQSLAALPFTLATNNSVFGYNVSLLLMLWLDAFAMYLFVFDLTRKQEAGWIAGAIYAFNPFNLGNLAQLQLVTLGFLPLALLFLGKVLSPGGVEARGTRVWKFAFLFGLFFVLQSLASFYYALLSGFAVGLYLLWWVAIVRARVVDEVRRVIVPLAVAFGLAGLVLLPFLLPYFQVQRELGFQRRVEESEPFSASLKQFTEVAPQNVVYGKFLAPNPVKRVGGYPLDTLFPGLIAVALALVGMVGSRTQVKYFLLLLLVVSFVLSLGPRLYLSSLQATDIPLPYLWLYDILPILGALRAPVRFDALVNLALAGLAGLGAATLLARFRFPREALVSLGVVGLIALEYLSLPAANAVVLPVANEIPEQYKWLAQQSDGVTLELPMMGRNEENELDISTQYFSTYHWQKTPDGYSGFVPPRRGEVAFEMLEFPSPRSVALAQALDVNRFLVPVGMLDNSVLPDALEIQEQLGEAQVVAVTLHDLEPKLDIGFYAPMAAAGAPFRGYLIVVNRDTTPYAVKPTDRATVQVQWEGGETQEVSTFIPLVTSSASVIPLELNAPHTRGDVSIRLGGADEVLGTFEVQAQVPVGDEIAAEVVLPASVELAEPLESEVERGETIRVPMRWLPFNKINAYFSASVRLVDGEGNKVQNVDRQPVVETLLWKPDEPVLDTFELTVPPDAPPGEHVIEVLMYQGNTGESALLLDGDYVPREIIRLGEITVK